MSFSVLERNILRDNKSGSSEILDSVLNYNLQYLKDRKPDSKSLGHLSQFNKKVQEKFSAMAIVANGLNRANQIMSESISDKKLSAKVPNKLERLIKDIAKIDGKIIKNCSVLFAKRKDKISIATYSNSGLVKKVIKHYRKKINKIYLSEARPAYEGRKMAQYFADIGLEVVLSVDARLPNLISRAELLLLGADAIGKDMFINKIGSEVLLKSAGMRGVKSVILFESLKIKKINKNTNLKDNYSYREIWPRSPDKNINVINQYFEIIDNRKAVRFISDLGVDTPQSLKQRIIVKSF